MARIAKSEHEPAPELVRAVLTDLGFNVEVRIFANRALDAIADDLAQSRAFLDRLGIPSHGDEDRVCTIAAYYIRKAFGLPIPEDHTKEGLDMAAAKKAAAKKGKRPEKAAKDGPGVIDTILECMGRDKGAAVEEMVEVLAKRFPDRSADGMRKTVRVQTSRLAAKGHKITKERDEKRGLVYYCKG